jgi:hypothetical protein
MQSLFFIVDLHPIENNASSGIRMKIIKLKVAKNQVYELIFNIYDKESRIFEN